MVVLQNTAGMYGIYRLVHTMKNAMKVMHIGSKLIHIGSKLIHIVCVYTECALTAIQNECAFSQSPSMNGLKPV